MISDATEEIKKQTHRNSKYLQEMESQKYQVLKSKLGI